MKLRSFLAEAKIKKPRGGDYFLEGNKILKIHTVSKGYAYIDTGKVERIVVPVVDLKVHGMNKGKTLWVEEWDF